VNGVPLSARPSSADQEPQTPSHRFSPNSGDFKPIASVSATVVEANGCVAPMSHRTLSRNFRPAVAPTAEAAHLIPQLLGQCHLEDLNDD
jgi:hypothetical protein